MTGKTDELLPCPFCGSHPTIEPWHGGAPTKKLISCSNGEYGDEHGGCSVRPCVSGETEAEARAAWNRRAPAQLAVKALEWADDDGGYAHADIPFGISYWAHYNGWELGAGERQYCADISDAKAAAQADYERRILSALVSAPAGAGAGSADVVERAFVDLCEAVGVPATATAALEYKSRTALSAQGWRTPGKLSVSGVSLEVAQALVEQFGGDETDMTVEFIADGHSGPGFYSWCTEYPEDGSSFLGPASEFSYLSALPAAPTAQGGAK